MSLGLAFYILLLISFVFSSYANGWAFNNRLFGSRLLLYALLLLLGWQVFGPPLHH